MYLRHLSLITIFVTLCLVALGGVVHNTQASLACPDWPLCYGQLMPKMEGLILLEHGHRLMGALVGFLNLLLFFFSWRLFKGGSSYISQRAYRLSGLTLFLVCVQGVLGGITVIYRLPTIVSTTHLTLALVYLGLICLLDHEYRKQWKREKNILPAPTDSEKNKFLGQWKPLWRHLSAVVLGLVFVQMVLGAFIRHLGAGAACGLGPGRWHLCFDVTTWELALWPASHAAEIHMVHRLFALIVTLAIWALGLLLWRKLVAFPSNTPYRGQILTLTLFAMTAVFAQVFLGVLTVYYSLANIPTALHLVVGTLLTLSLWKLFLVLKDWEEWHGLKESHSLLSDLLELTKPRLASLVMMTVAVGLFMAPGEINFFIGLLAMALIFLLVAGSTTLNCYLERETDKLMDRTKDRPLPSGRLKAEYALYSGILLHLVSLSGLFFLINPLTAFLGLLASITYLMAYTPLKKSSLGALYIGAISGALPPVMGWTTVMGELGAMAWFLFLILFVWQLPHFIAISLYHAKDYGRAQLMVVPNQMGTHSAKRGILLSTLFLAFVAILPGHLGHTSEAYTWVAIVLSIAIFLYALKGFFLSSIEDLTRRWARGYFIATIAYLPLLLGSMIFLK